MKLVDGLAMRRMDRKAVRQYGIREIVLMENAGRGVADIAARYIRGSNRRISILAGKGNNGGDGFVAARHLSNRGFDVTVLLLVNPSDVRGNPKVNKHIWERMGGKTGTVRTARELKSVLSSLKHSALIVDAIFGTGLSATVRGHYAKVIDTINDLSVPVVAVDIPSGLNASTGAVMGHAIKAEVTATMVLPKIGLVTHPGVDYAGVVEVVDIGMPRELTDDESIPWDLVDGGMAGGMVRPRMGDAHKGSCGHSLVLAGSPGKTGAAYMTAIGALRSGAGLVTLGVPESLHAIMEAKTTEVMTAPLPETASHTVGSDAFCAVTELMEGKDAVVIGPGLGVNSEVRGLVVRLIEESPIPLIIDADGLNVIAGHLSVLRRAKAPVIVTPHPGEMARLLGKAVAYVQGNRVGVATDFAKKHKVTLVLKGARTVTAGVDGAVFFNTTGNSGMATAGTGDILSGVIGALVGQGYDPIDAAVAGVYLHGLAGDRVAEARGAIGMVATDILEEVPPALSSIINAEYTGEGGDLPHIVS
ncbi:MAG: NAD(P)H-hydrate dehydratase [Deltaproteobacteria bacterium]|nr:NAD(P)H-hydrate dehydratase [Deltaproteobacteria bacterium]